MVDANGGGESAEAGSIAHPNEATAIRAAATRCLRTPTTYADLMASKPAGPYTPVVRAGEWVIVSGQLGLRDGALVEGGVGAQTAQAVANLVERLAEQGATSDHVAKPHCF